jgi:hypothetical protein
VARSGRQALKQGTAMQPIKRSDHVELQLNLEQLETLESAFQYVKMINGNRNAFKKTVDAETSAMAYSSDSRSLVLTWPEYKAAIDMLSKCSRGQDLTFAWRAAKLSVQMTLQSYDTDHLLAELDRRGFDVAIVRKSKPFNIRPRRRSKVSDAPALPDKEEEQP